MRPLLILALLLTACGSSTTRASEPTTGPVTTGTAPAGTTPAPPRSAPAPAATATRCEQMGGRCQAPVAMNVCGSWKDGADTGCTGGWGCCLPR